MSTSMQKTLGTEVFSVLLLAIAIIAGFYFYSNFGDLVVTHWNTFGQPDGYSTRFMGAFFGPMILLGVYILSLIVQGVISRRDIEVDEDSLRAYDFFKGTLMFIIFAIFILSGLYNLGYAINMSIFTPVLVGIMLIVTGIYLFRIRSSWLLGVRTRWTLSSDTAWNKAHKFAGTLFIILGLLIILTPFFNFAWGSLTLLSGILIILVATLIYSYVVYRREHRRI